MKNRIIIATFIALLVTGLSIKAGLIQTNTTSFGPDSLTVDTLTGLGWLNLSNSVGLSYQQVLADTQAGGIFSGFRFATDQEVMTLFISVGISGAGDYSGSDPLLQYCLSLVGATSFQDGHPEAIGISGTTKSGGQYVPEIDFLYVSGIPTYRVSATDLVYGGNTSFATVGSWLVTEVPEPTIYTLTVIGLVGLAFFKRREDAA
jgi:hypothetical protein